ncbi:hypothetical protein ACFVIL_12510 [Streptomyces sp. NPDC127159]|uniref:hypothetical protein n=1 Tax=unclassified Streptomyces TaxID=2593676 RepID=UPI003634FAF0
MSHWVYMFSGCPDIGSYQQITNEVEPGEVMVLERAARPGIVDGFVRDSVDDVMMVTHYRWVASGAPSTVMPEIRRTLGLSWPPESTVGNGVYSERPGAL